MNIWDLFILALVALAVVFALRTMRKRKRGGCCCGSSCSGCAQCAQRGDCSGCSSRQL